MKKLSAVAFMAMLFSIGVFAQESQRSQELVNPVHITAETCYEQLFLDDAGGTLKSSWAFDLSLGFNDYLTKNFYWGLAAGVSVGDVEYDLGELGRFRSTITDIRLPLVVGLSGLNGYLKLDTGPFVDFTVGGTTDYFRPFSDTVTTKLKDMDVKKVALGWAINLRILKWVKISYSFKLSDSIYGDGGDVGFLSIGLAGAIF